MKVSPLLQGILLLAVLIEAHSAPFRDVFRWKTKNAIDMDQTRKNNNESFSFQSKNDPKETSDWLTVDPYAILSTLTDAGEHVFADSLYRDLKTFQRVVQCKDSKLHITKRDLILQNVTVGYRKQPPLMTIGTLRLRWKSYSEPTFSIEIDDVDILIRFENMFLTKTNWNHFCDKVFPRPDECHHHIDNVNEAQEKHKKSPTWIRIASISLGGNVQVRIKSRPMKEEFGVLVYNASDFRDISAAIKKQSQSNLWLTGKNGLSLSELRVMAECAFLKKAHLHAIAAIHEFAHDNPQEALRLQLDLVMYKVTEALNNAAKVTETTMFQTQSLWRRSQLASTLSCLWPKDLSDAAKAVAKKTARQTRKFKDFPQRSFSLISKVSKKLRHRITKSFLVTSKSKRR